VSYNPPSADPNDVFYEVDFVVGIEATFDDYGTATLLPRFSDAWSSGPQGQRNAEERLVRVKIEVPQSMWRLPMLRGKMKSDLNEEFQAWVEEIR
jgi:hypothetical protein